MRGSVIAVSFEYARDSIRSAKVLSKKKNGWLKVRYLTPPEFAGQVAMVRNSPKHVHLLDEAYLVSLGYVKTPVRVRRMPQDMMPPQIVRQRAFR